MKWLLAMMSQGRDISEFFPDVVKNVMAKSVEVKKMVYVYLVHYADFDKRCREIALLSINSFQKDLAGQNQLIRGLALRVLTSIRVPDVIQIQLYAVRRCSTDSSPYVRKCAAIALPKLFAFDPLHLTELEEILVQLLQDSSTMVLGSSIAAFNEICPTNFKIIHPNYRKLCHLLADLDEWTQVPLLDMMTRYAREHFMDPSPGRAAAARQQAKNRSTSASKGSLTAFTAVRRRVVKKAFYSDEEDESDDEIVMLPAAATSGTSGESNLKVAEKGSVFIGADADIEGDLDPDHRLLLKSSLPLLKSRNAGVVLGVASLHYYCGSRTSATTVQLGKALVRILKNHREIQFVVLTSIITMAQDQPSMFTPYLSEFFIKSTDPVFNRLLKLDILAALATRDNAELILRELQIYVRHANLSFVSATIRAVGRIADVAPGVVESCMEGLLHLLLYFSSTTAASSKSDIIVGEVVVTLRQILQQNIHSRVSTTILHKLLKLLLTSDQMAKKTQHSSSSSSAVARASIVWLIGEFHEILSKLAPDLLRILAIGFPDEETETKTQIANFSLKLSLRLPDDENVQTMMTYVLEMARYDPDTDLRDRARFMTAIMGLAPPSSSVDEQALELLSRHAEAILLAPKLPPLTLQGPVDLEGLPHFTLGSLSSVVGHYAKGYAPIAPWPETETDPTVRDVIHEKTTPVSLNSRKEFDAGEATTTRPSSSKQNHSFLSSSSEEDEEEESDGDSSSSSDGSSTGSSSSDESSDEDKTPLAKQIQQKTTAPPPSRVGVGIRRVGGMARKADEPIFSAMTDSKNLLDIPESSSPKSFFHEEPPPQAPARGYDLLADQFDFLQASPMTTAPAQVPPVSASSTSTSGFFSQIPSPNAFPSITPTPFPVSAPAVGLLDDSSVLAQIMESFPKQQLSSPTGTQQGALNSFVAPSPVQHEEILSMPKILLRPEVASGLQISLLFRHGNRPAALPGASCLYLEIANCSKDHSLRYCWLTDPALNSLSSSLILSLSLSLFLSVQTDSCELSWRDSSNPSGGGEPTRSE
jgi:AP-3 complex subunit beta